MVSAPERMFGHQLCKHLLTHKSCLGKHRKQRGQGSPDLETLLSGIDGYFTPTAENLLLTEDQSLIYTFRNERSSTFWVSRPKLALFCTNLQVLCNTSTLISNTRDFNPVITNTRYWKQHFSYIWIHVHDMTTLTVQLHFQQGSEVCRIWRERYKNKVPTDFFFSFKYIFSWFFACRRF